LSGSTARRSDVEGSEAAVLAGMSKTLARLRPRALVIEIKRQETGADRDAARASALAWLRVHVHTEH
jgi:hypothetical protein